MPPREPSRVKSTALRGSGVPLARKLLPAKPAEREAKRVFDDRPIQKLTLNQ